MPRYEAALSLRQGGAPPQDGLRGVFKNPTTWGKFLCSRPRACLRDPGPLQRLHNHGAADGLTTPDILAIGGQVRHLDRRIARIPKDEPVQIVPQREAATIPETEKGRNA